VTVEPETVDDTTVQLTGIPLMSPNCWGSIQDAVRARPGCRYLEWGSGNSTIALLRSALDRTESSPFEIHSVENNPAFVGIMIDAIAETFRRAKVDGPVRVEPLRFPKPALSQALGTNPAVSRYEAHFLKMLWYTRNDRFWVASAHPSGPHSGRIGALRRYLIALRCSAAFRLEQVQRALGDSSQFEPATDGGMAQSPTVGRLKRASRVVFDTERGRLDFIFVPQLTNRFWQGGPLLDGLYQQFADYVSVPVEGQFDVILVDGRARTSCLKRVHYDEMLAPGGVLFLHDAHRPSQLEGLQLFRPWSYVRGSGDAARAGDERPEPPLVRSGSSLQHVEAVFDRELYFYEAPTRT
jgi:hypothetical protein